MTNLDDIGFRQARSFALEQLVTVYSTSGDLRWALIALVVQSVAAAWSYGRARVVKRAREAVRRLAPARSTVNAIAADTMVAAGRC